MNIAQARIKHHSISSTASFSVPASENFTDGTWNPTNLVLNEIGVNETTESVFIRIGSSIHQIITDNSQRFSEYIDVFGGIQGNLTTGSEEIIYSTTLPASYLTDQTGFHIRAGLRTGTNNDPKEFSLKVGGRTVYDSTADINNPNDNRFLVDFDFIRVGTASIGDASISGSSQISTATMSNSDFNVGVGVLGTFSWSSPIDIQITASASNVDDIELFTCKIYDIR